MNNDRVKLEQQVLWACIMNPGKFARYSNVLTPDKFTDPQHKEVAETLLNLLAQGYDINPATVSAATNAPLPIPEEGRDGYVDVGLGAKRLTEWALLDLKDATIAKLTGVEEPFDVLDTVNGATNTGSALISAHEHTPKDRMIAEYISSIEENQSGRILHIPTGFPALDMMTKGGLKIGNTSFLGGAPGTGKTSLMLQIAMNAANRGFGTAIIEGEMLTEELLLRMNGQYSRIPYHEIERGDAMGSVLEFSEYLMRIPMEVTGTYNRTVENLVGAIRRSIQNGAKLICVDYMQVFVAKGNAKDEFSQIKALSEALRQITLVNRVHLLVASSLNRLEVGAKELTLNSFYGGSQLGHDCWAGMILAPDGDVFIGEEVRNLTLNVVKVRGGRTGKFSIRYELETQYMSEQTDIEVRDKVKPEDEVAPDLFNEEAV